MTEYTPSEPATTAATTAPTTTPAPEVNLDGKLLLVSVGTHCPTFTRKDKGETAALLQKTGAEAEAATVNKRIVDKKQLSKVTSILTTLKEGVLKYATPTGNKGTYAVRSANFIPLTDEWNKHYPTVLDRKEEFLTYYGGLLTDLQQSKARLGTMYDEKDFPTVEEIRSRISVELNVSALTDPSQLNGLADVIVEAAQKDYDGILDNARKSVWKQVTSLVGGLTAALKSADRIHASHWEKLHEYVELAPTLLPGEDTELNGHLDTIKQLLISAPKELVTQSEEVRKSATEVADATLTQLKDRFAAFGI